LTRVGRIGLGPLPGAVGGGPFAVAVTVGVVLAGAVLALSAVRLGQMSLEAAEHRGRMAAQLRFALSLQDLRAVILLRRRLAAEEPRARPWARLGAGRPVASQAAVPSVPWRALPPQTPLSPTQPPRGLAKRVVSWWRGPGAAVRRRGLHSLLRWPTTRVLRVAALGLVAGFAAGG